MLYVLGVLLVIGLGLAGWSAFVARKAEELVPAEGQCVDVRGARLHYVALGPQEAPAIVMVHGLMGQLRNFSHSLAARLEGDYRLILVDRPGWGYSRLTGKRPDLAAQGAMIGALIEALAVEKPLLVGHSMGGAVSLALALQRPELVRGLALIAPYTQPVDTPPAVFKGLVVPRALRALVAWTLAVPIALATAKAKSRAVFAPDPVPADFPTRGGAALGIRPSSFQSGCFEMGIARDAMIEQAPRYPEIRLPVAILYGRGDALLDPALHGGTTAEAIPGASLTLVEGGHMLPVTHAAATEAWLRRVLNGS
jgi:pimeloyl-ACP methyl ester carboxylesterase